MTAIADNYKLIQERMRRAALAAGRDPMSIALVAVSKFHSPERIREAAAAGLSIFGESRQQEAKEKLPALKDLGEWHFIGSLQTNKARSIAELFDVVQSVDSLRLAEKLAQAATELGKQLRVYAQVNISGEPQKHGFALDDLASIRQIAAQPALKLEGLMGMAAAFDDPEQARPNFAALRALRERLAPELPGLKLSMGMSDDLEAAIAEGSDMVRVGTALFQ